MALGGNVRIGGVALDPQPSRFDAIPPQPPRRRMPSGGYVSSYLDRGWRFRLTYGDRRYSLDTALADLRARLGTPPTTVTLQYRDHTGAEPTHTVLVDQDVGDLIEVGGLAGQFAIELVEGS